MSSSGCSRRRAETPQAYFAAPFDAVLCRARFICVGFAPDVFCLSAWGFLEAADFDELCEVFDAAVSSPHQQRRQLVLHEALEGATSAALGRFVRYIRRRPGAFAGVCREALCRGHGLVGFVADGIYGSGVLPFPGRAFSERTAAIAWLGDDLRYRASEICDELAALEKRYGPPRDPLLADLHRLFERDRWNTTLTESARELGMSARSLQRRLRKAGTSFDRLRRDAVLTAAKAELEDSTRTVKQVALSLGYASAESFSTAFRSMTGASPSQWRRDNRDASA